MKSPSNDNDMTKSQTSKCPICDKNGDINYAPFCSKRCADVDLHRWLSGGYAVPAEEDESDGMTFGADEA